MNRLLLGSLAMVFALTSPVFAQDSNYAWDNSKGGLVDLETGLVWGFGPSNVWGIGYNYASLPFAVDLWEESEWSYGFSDWRIPTLAELQDAASKNVYFELSGAAYDMGLEQPYQGGYWAADSPVRVKGFMVGYYIDLNTGEWATAGVNSQLRAIVVRGIAPPPSGGGKGKNK